MKRYIFFVIVLFAIVGGVFFVRQQYFVSKPYVSVVMSTYNRAHLLSRVIKSVLKQTYADFEFIIIDDGSTDDTVDVVRYYQNQDPRIVFLQNKQNAGLIASLNRGIQAAKGKYIARIDDDDEMLSTRLEKQVNYFKEHPEATVLGTGYYAYKYRDEKDEKKSRYRIHLGCPSPTEQVFVNMMRGNGFAHSTTMIDREYLIEKGIQYHPDFKSAEDYRLWFDILSTGGQMHCLSDPLTEYTRAGDNPSSFYKNMTESTKKVQVLFLSLLTDEAEDLNKKTECEIARELVAQNAVKKILDQERLSKKIKEVCPPENIDYLKVEHSNWTDYFILTDNKTRLYRYKKTDQTAQVLSFKKGNLRVKWDRWGKETFICDMKTKECVWEEKNDSKKSRKN